MAFRSCATSSRLPQRGQRYNTWNKPCSPGQPREHRNPARKSATGTSRRKFDPQHSGFITFAAKLVVGDQQHLVVGDPLDTFEVGRVLHPGADVERDLRPEDARLALE